MLLWSLQRAYQSLLAFVKALQSLRFRAFAPLQREKTPRFERIQKGKGSCIDPYGVMG